MYIPPPRTTHHLFVPTMMAVPNGYDNMKVRVQLAVPDPDRVDLDAVRAVFPYGACVLSLQVLMRAFGARSYALALVLTLIRHPALKTVR